MAQPTRRQPTRSDDGTTRRSPPGSAASTATGSPPCGPAMGADHGSAMALMRSSASWPPLLQRLEQVRYPQPVRPQRRRARRSAADGGGDGARPAKGRMIVSLQNFRQARAAPTRPAFWNFWVEVSLAVLNGWLKASIGPPP